jgi:hypothetical protein
MKNKVAIWNTPDNENATQADLNAISLKGGDFLLKTPLPEDWWQRPFRGFEARLPF